MSTKSVYFFGNKHDAMEANTLPCILGGKGASLYLMGRIGIPVPPGFVISTDECKNFAKNESVSLTLWEQVEDGLRKIEEQVGFKFGASSMPLLVSVRSGAQVSMPGMMDTILNIGLCDKTVDALAQTFNNKIFALDSYRRFIQMYGSVVMGVPMYKFEEALSDIKIAFNIKQDCEMGELQWQKFINVAKQIVVDFTGMEIPSDPCEQLKNSIIAVMKSWNNERAQAYRKIHNIPDSYGTAVTVQAMVFGNLNKNSATGVAFTRNPSTGENKVYGEYMVMAQGEDVVSGVRTPQPIETMKDTMPSIFNELKTILSKLESHYRDLQDVEFTIQDGKLWILQTRNAKRHINAAIKIAHDFVIEGAISKEEAIERIDTKELPKLLHPHGVISTNATIIGTGLPASPGVGSGIVVFSAEDAETMCKTGKKVVLAREETSPEDIKGMYISSAIVTTRGGMTSHAAVVARGMGVPCVVGCESIFINHEQKTITTSRGTIIKEGDVVSIDGTNGLVVVGEVTTEMPSLSGEMNELLKWADEMATTKVRANAETLQDCEVAIKFGTAGIGLCRTEHMFFEERSLLCMRKAILCNKENAAKHLEEIIAIQKEDFKKLFKMLNGLPINIRLLDPPLHEFLPIKEKAIEEFCAKSGFEIEFIKGKIAKLKEHNPMLGNRGVRLGISFPEIYVAQANAIFNALTETESDGIKVNLEIMIPLVHCEKELTFCFEMINSTKNKVEKATGRRVNFKTCSMIELPAACLAIKDMANVVSHFSFGTNDLTQTTLGMSRDDYESFLNAYKLNGIFAKDPFTTVHPLVMKLMQIAVNDGEGCTFSVCGEHGGDAESIKLFSVLNLNYTSCSPYRIPIARIAAAQSAIQNLQC